VRFFLSLYSDRIPGYVHRDDMQRKTTPTVLLIQIPVCFPVMWSATEDSEIFFQTVEFVEIADAFFITVITLIIIED
jgi:hypothetical protein